ncbi:unnamed protein product [Dicrocoelium dendriticum]|nr:unnamed protein product [Dicrocoelium dendriticum]
MSSTPWVYHIEDIVRFVFTRTGNCWPINSQSTTNFSSAYVSIISPFNLIVPTYFPHLGLVVVFTLGSTCGHRGYLLLRLGLHVTSCGVRATDCVPFWGSVLCSKPNVCISMPHRGAASS